MREDGQSIPLYFLPRGLVPQLACAPGELLCTDSTTAGGNFRFWQVMRGVVRPERISAPEEHIGAVLERVKRCVSLLLLRMTRATTYGSRFL